MEASSGVDVRWAGITSHSAFVSALTAELVGLRLGPACDTRQREGVLPGSPVRSAPLQAAAPHQEPCGDSQTVASLIANTSLGKG
jgi:hypothetical protein